MCNAHLNLEIQRNKLMHLEDTLVIYGVYNAEALEKLIKTVHTLHIRQSMYESLFAGQITKVYEYYLHGCMEIVIYYPMPLTLHALFENNKR